jgi:hypothetical protein
MNQDDFCRAKAVLFQGNSYTPELLPKSKPRNQRWFLLSQEPLTGRLSDTAYRSFFDELVGSYNMDTFAPLPYGLPSYYELMTKQATLKDSKVPVGKLICLLMLTALSDLRLQLLCSGKGQIFRRAHEIYWSGQLWRMPSPRGRRQSTANLRSGGVGKVTVAMV